MHVSRRLLPAKTLFIFALTLSAAIYGAQPAKAQTTVTDFAIEQFGAPPAVPDGPLTTQVETALGLVLDDSLIQSTWDPTGLHAMNVVAQSKDPRVVWTITDMLRFTWQPQFGAALVDTAIEILEFEPEPGNVRGQIIDRLMAWDIPAYPGYLAHKRTVLTKYIPGWDRILVKGNIDWHLVDWGGVNIDARPFDQTDEMCSCIPAADNPDVSSADDATWLKDDDVVFGIEVNGEYRAYPRRIMEIREMVNDTLGGRDLGIPYCTLCGAAQAYFTDDLPDGIERPVLRTSGLLIRSNKVMYDVNTYSVFDTFTGAALTGPLADKNLKLDQATVITTEWGAWKAAHPETTVLVEELALGRDFDLRNTRDANGPIFPVGDVDPRLPVHEDVIGVFNAAGEPVAFQRSAAIAALSDGADIEFQGVRIELDGGGPRAVGTDGSDLGSHQAFWFAWSQFHPETTLWP